VDTAVASQNLDAAQWIDAFIEAGYAASSFAYEDDSSRDVPRAQMRFKKRIETTGRHIREIKRCGPGPTDSPRMLHQVAKSRQILIDAFESSVWKSRSDERFIERRRVAHPSPDPIDEKTAAPRGCEQFVAGHVEHDTEDKFTISFKCNAHPVRRHPVGKISRPIDRIDDPPVLRGFRRSLALVFLSQNLVSRKGLKQNTNDVLLRRNIRIGNEVVRTFRAYAVRGHPSRVSLNDRCSAARGPYGHFFFLTQIRHRPLLTVIVRAKLLQFFSGKHESMLKRLGVFVSSSAAMLFLIGGCASDPATDQTADLTDLHHRVLQVDRTAMFAGFERLSEEPHEVDRYDMVSTEDGRHLEMTSLLRFDGDAYSVVRSDTTGAIGPCRLCGLIRRESSPTTDAFSRLVLDEDPPYLNERGIRAFELESAGDTTIDNRRAEIVVARAIEGEPRAGNYRYVRLYIADEGRLLGSKTRLDRSTFFISEASSREVYMVENAAGSYRPDRIHIVQDVRVMLSGRRITETTLTYRPSSAPSATSTR
jgi:hypothetical protein